MKNPLAKTVDGHSPQRGGFFCLSPVFWFSALLLFIISCGSDPPPLLNSQATDIIPVSGTPQPAQQNNGGGIADEIRVLTETGTPSSALRALDIIRSRNLQSTEFGRVMSAVNVTFLRTVYPSVLAQLPIVDPPLTHLYSRILRDAERGVYTPPQRNSADYIEYVLPFLAYYPAPGKSVPPESYLSALPDLERALGLNTDSVLARYFRGIVYEYAGRLDDALSAYSQTWDLFPECFPAALGMARVMENQGRREDSVRFLQDLVVQMPDNFQIKRQLALAYYNIRDWSRAETAVAEILQIDNRDADFVLMRAHILVEQGFHVRAQAPLDIYATINPNNTLYLFLRARVQAEAFNNRDAALNYLRSIIRSSSSSEFVSEASIYAVKLFMESPRLEDQSEGRELLGRLMSVPEPSLDIISLALDDAIRREAWAQARPFLNRLLSERRSFQDLLAAYRIEKELGNNAAALAFARELYDQDRNNEEGIIAYITALIDTGRRDEAAAMINGRLNSVSSGPLRSRYFFLQSRVRPNEELTLNDLRSSLFEDPRNLDALIAMFEIYYRRRDERRAAYYLRQALAQAPNNQRLRRFEAEFIRTFGSF